MDEWDPVPWPGFDPSNCPGVHPTERGMYCPPEHRMSAKLSSGSTCKWSGLVMFFTRRNAGNEKKWKEMTRNEKKLRQWTNSEQKWNELKTMMKKMKINETNEQKWKEMNTCLRNIFEKNIFEKQVFFLKKTEIANVLQGCFWSDVLRKNLRLFVRGQRCQNKVSLDRPQHEQIK